MAVFDPDQLHAEHAAWREDVLTMHAPATQPIDQTDLLATTMRIHHRLIQHGIIPPSGGH